MAREAARTWAWSALLGLPSTRTREWLLPIAYRKRETFA